MRSFLIKIIRYFLKESEPANSQKFERLYFFLKCCRNPNHVSQLQKLIDNDLTETDYHSQQYQDLMIAKFRKEIELATSQYEVLAIREREGDFIIHQLLNHHENSI